METTKITRILNKAEKTHELADTEILYLLKLKGKSKEKLYQKADQIREKYLGNEIHLRGIIEFSNYCHCNCYYCGLRADNDQLERYRMSVKEIVQMAENAGNLGYKTLVLQSGEDEYYDTEKITSMIEKIKKRVDTAITLCAGERDFKEYEIWKKAGADRYLLRHETADPDLYQKFHPGREVSSRIKRLKWLKELGYQVGSGNLIGLPGQDQESIVKDIKLFKELDLEMVGLGPFISNPNTPLENAENGSVEMSLKTIAITRLLLPKAHIPGTTALGSLDPQGRQKALKVGANIVMPNVTIGDYRPLYELYPSKICIEEEPDNCRQCIGGIIRSLDREVGSGYGHYQKNA